MLVENKIILEIKSNNKFIPFHEAQILTYMKLARVSITLLLIFNIELLKEEIRRFVL